MREQPQTPWHLHAHTNTRFTCVRLSASRRRHTVFTGCCVKEYVIWKRTCSCTHSRPLSKPSRKTRKGQKDEGFGRLKSSIGGVFLSELYVRPPCPHWDLSNPCFIIGSRFGIRIGANLGQSRLISRRFNMTDFTPPRSKKNMRSGGNFLITVIHCNLLELVLKLDTLLPLLFQANFETFQPVVPLYAGWSQRGSLLFQVQHRRLKKRREEWKKLPHKPASKDNYGL